MNIALLQGSLATSGNAGLESTDPRFDEIATLVQEGNYLIAANLSQAIIADEIYDIRLISYFLYAHWLEQGMASMTEIIQSLCTLIAENWEAIAPAHKREKSIQTSLSWMFRLLLKKVQYEEKKQTVLWQQWLTSINTTEVAEMLSASAALRLTLDKQLGGNAKTILELWSKIEHWLHNFAQMVTDPPVLTVPESEPADNAGKEVSHSVPIPTFKVDHLNIELSYHMVLLLKKLAAFEHLLQAQNFSRAALVADDINQTLANFDPMLYFPKTFEAFFRLQALNFEELSAYEEHRGSPQWQAMQEWLKIDVDSFMSN
jgi:hypothetical protein